MKQIYFILIAMLLLVPLASAESSFMFKQHETNELNIPVFNNDNSKAGVLVNCFLSLNFPNTTLFLDDVQMSYNANGHFNYTIPGKYLYETGKYYGSMRCDNGADYGFSAFTVEVNPTGKSSSSIMDNSLLIILLFLAIMCLGIGIYLENYYLGVISGFVFTIAGVYTLIYGFGNITSLYTRGIGFVLIGLGLFFTIVAAYEWILESGGEAGGEES